MPGRILVVDDQEENRLILEAILEDTYTIDMAADGEEAIALLTGEGEKPILVLSDVYMPGVDGFGLLSFIKADPVLRKIPVVFITASSDEDKGLAAGAIDFITKPFRTEIVRMRVSNQIELAQYRAELERMVEEKVGEIIATKEVFLDALAEMIEHRHLESGKHIERIKNLTAIFVEHLLKHPKYGAELLSLNPRSIIKASALHDIGKIGTPDNILLKPGRLTSDEFEIMKNHSSIGSDMIAPMLKKMSDINTKNYLIHDIDDNYLKHCYDIARYHHEKWNGTGYPDKLSGEDIPLSARIVAIVDVYEALTSDRCYKKAMTHEEAVAVIVEGSGTHFEAGIVEAMLEVHEEIRGTL